jgi:1-acyl-sn-glycerol-3-phosphate acyltransferase
MFGYISSFYMIILMVATAAPLFLICFVIWLVTFPFDKKLKILHQYTCFCGTFYFFMMPNWWFKLRGRKKIRRNATYMVVANHQSQVDILACLHIFFHFKFVSKAEVFRLPFYGWFMELNKYIKLRRGFVGSINQMMRDCERNLAEGNSVLLFPEGTRSLDGEIKTFKTGAFILAQKQNVPILPIVINGTKDALPKKSLKLSGIHKIHVKVLDEIPYESFANNSAEEITTRVQSMMVQELAAMRQK